MGFFVGQLAGQKVDDVLVRRELVRRPDIPKQHEDEFARKNRILMQYAERLNKVGSYVSFEDFIQDFTKTFESVGEGEWAAGKVKVLRMAKAQLDVGVQTLEDWRGSRQQQKEAGVMDGTGCEAKGASGTEGGPKAQE